jgi:CubicO group peptidase (beta-lactamase class C family)
MRNPIRAVLLALASAGVHAADGSPATRPAAPDVAAFVQELDALRKQAHIPGLSFAVVKDGAIVVAGGLGLADVEAAIPATAQTPYDIASVAKPLSAVLALKLVELGTLDLDAPIAQGSDWHGFCADFSQQPSIFARDLRCQPASHTLRHLLSHTATGTPGTRFSYNPVLFSWASRPIMEAAGAPFSALVERHVFGPAGMTHSARRHRDLPLREDLARRQAQHYRIDDTGTPVRGGEREPQGDGAAGGVVSTVLDLARFDIALDAGRLIAADSRTAMMAPTPASDGEPLPYGLGWFVQSYRGTPLVWHSGWWEDAYSALYLKSPAHGLSFIILANSEGIWWDNPLDQAQVERSRFAQAFLAAFIR